MPIGTGIIYNVGDLILSTVSGSGTAFLETKIAAATSSIVYFDSNARINSASLNSITVGTASYVSGSTSIITNLTASNISASGTSSFGYVGIGTTVPSAKLHIQSGSILLKGATTPGLNLEPSGVVGNADISFDGTSFILVSNSNSADLRLSTNSTPRLTILAGGNVGIGTTVPGALLEISSSTAASLLNIKGAGGNNILYVSGSGGVGINTNSPTGKLHVVETTATGSRIQLGTSSENALMNSGSTVDLLILNAPYGVNSATTSNIGAKWGIKFIGAVDSLSNSLGKTSAIYAVSEDVLGYNRGTSLAFYTNQFNDLPYAERMRIYHNGNIGIGTTSPGYKLTIQNDAASTNALLGLQNFSTSSTTNHGVSILPILSDNTGSTAITAGGLYWLKEQQWTNDTTSRDSYLRIDTTENGSASEKVRITSAGIVGIGTSSPNSWAKLEVNGTTAVNGILYINENYKIQALTAFPGSAGKLILNGDGGNVGVGTTSAYSKLTISVPATNTISTADSSNTAGLTISGTGNLVRLQFGVGSSTLGPYGGWIQASYDNTGGNDGIEPLLLNPSGGSIGIGTSSPSQLVEAYKSANSDIVFKITNPNTGSIATAQYYASNGTTQSQFFHTGTNFSGAGVLNYAGLGGIYNSATGISLAATNASGVILFGTGTSVTERMRIAADGNVGIGTTNPTAKLTVNQFFGFSGDKNNYIYMPDIAQGTGSIYMQAGFGSAAAGGAIKLHGHNATTYTGGDVEVGMSEKGDFLINTSIGGTRRVTVKNNGNVGIGTTVPAYLLDVSGSSRFGFTSTNTHQFTGSVSVVGSVTAASFTGSLSGSITSALTASYLTPTNSYTITNLTASNISASATGSFGIVGIGTSSPVAALDVSRLEYPSLGGVLANFSAGTTDPTTEKYVILRQTYTGTAFDSPMLVFRANANSANSGSFGIVRTTSNGSIVFSNVDATSGTVTAVSEKMRIAADGNVGIGTTSPAYLLHVNSTGFENVAKFRGVNDTTIIIGGSDAGGSGEQYITYQNTTTAASAWMVGMDDGEDFRFAYGVAGEIDDSKTKVKIGQDGNVGIGTTTPAAKLEISGSSNSALLNIKSPISGAILFVSGSGAVGIGTSAVGAFTLQVSGSFGATTKSFIIEHPTKAGKKLMYGSLESPYHGIRLTGRDTLVNGKCKIQLPDYMYKLILHDSVNIQLTGIKCNKTLYIDDINVPENYFTIAYDKTVFESYKTYDFFWDFTAIRADVPELQTEM